ncbi:hypothetical protein NQ317_014940 [Molorchus minor]|uniref:Uncharacterized protein n=1 Tax=Molorchus minor TaxID=1323400 RepID=A0ABQ9JYR6_9CUCU|nr:hypothetical protein NQ317_014940 [Molorchus minor]
MMFEKLARIIEMQTSVLKELPTRVDKDKLKDYAHLNERLVWYADPKQLLEDGIRKELVQHISKALHSELTFNAKSKQEDIRQKLKSLGRIMDGYKRSFEYIQDYININGLKIWQEESYPYYQLQVCIKADTFPSDIHRLTTVYNFIGRLAREIRLTDPRNSLYLDQTLTWYDIKTRKPIFDKETIASITSSIEVAGLVGLDRLFSFMIITALQKLSGYLQNKNVSTNTWTNVLTSIQNEFKQSKDMQNPLKVYQTYINRSTKIWPEFLENALLVGQLQLNRNLIAFHLNKSCKFDAKNLESSLRSLNKNNLDYAIIFFVFVIAHLQKLFLPQNPGSLQKRIQDQIDGIAFSVAVHTMIRQFHKEINKEFIKYIVDYILQLTKNSNRTSDLLPEVILALNFMDSYTNYSEDSRRFYKEFLPEEIVHLQKILFASVCVSKAVPLSIQKLCVSSVGNKMGRTKFVLWPVVDSTPALTEVLYKGATYLGSFSGILVFGMNQIAGSGGCFDKSLK